MRQTYADERLRPDGPPRTNALPCLLSYAGNPQPKVPHKVLAPSTTQYKRVIIVGDVHGCAGAGGVPVLAQAGRVTDRAL